MVQEQPITNWFQTSGGQVSSEFQGLSPGSTIYCRFTQFSMPAQAAPQFNAPTNSGPFLFQDCEFHGGKLLSVRPTINFTNCLLERVYTDLQPKDSPATTYLRNCLLLGGAFTFAPTNSLVRDNFFDKTAITNWNGYAGTNAYVTGYQRLQPARRTISFCCFTFLSGRPVGKLLSAEQQHAHQCRFWRHHGQPGGPVPLHGLHEPGLRLAGKRNQQRRGCDLPLCRRRYQWRAHRHGWRWYRGCDFEDVNGDGSANGDPTSWTNYNSPNGLVGQTKFLIFTPLK